MHRVAEHLFLRIGGAFSPDDKKMLFVRSNETGFPEEIMAVSTAGGEVTRLYDFAKHRVTNLGALDVVPFWLGATREGKTVVFDQPGWEQTQIMLAENFR